VNYLGGITDNGSGKAIGGWRGLVAAVHKAQTNGKKGLKGTRRMMIFREGRVESQCKEETAKTPFQ